MKINNGIIIMSLLSPVFGAFCGVPHGVALAATLRFGVNRTGAAINGSPSPRSSHHNTDIIIIIIIIKSSSLLFHAFCYVRISATHAAALAFCRKAQAVVAQTGGGGWVGEDRHSRALMTTCCISIAANISAAYALLYLML